MSKWINVALIGLLSLQWSGCSTSRALVSYDNIDTSMQLKADSFNGKSLGVVKGDEGGAIWVNCTKSATESVRVMIARAKDLGANAIGNIRWFASGTSMPSCKKGWGYLIITPFILTPLFMSTEVEGEAFKVNGKSKKETEEGIFIIPKDRDGQEALAHKLAGKL